MRTNFRRALLLVLLVSVAGRVDAAVAFDAVGTADCKASSVVGGTGLTCATLTVGVGANRALIVQAAYSLKTIAAISMVWDSGGTNQAMTSIGAVSETDTSGRVELWGLVAPTSGAKTLKITFTGTSDVAMIGVAYTGVSQVGGVTSFPNFTSVAGTTATASVVVTSAATDMTVAVISDAVIGLTASSQTETFNEVGLALINAAGSRAAGAATVTHSWSTGTNPTAIAGVDIAAVAAAATTPTRALLGVGTH